MREEEILTYHGTTGRVTRSTVPGTSEEKHISLPEEEQDSPFFRVAMLETAIVKHVMQRVQQSQQEGL